MQQLKPNYKIQHKNVESQRRFTTKSRMCLRLGLLNFWVNLCNWCCTGHSRWEWVKLLFIARIQVKNECEQGQMLVEFQNMLKSTIASSGKFCVFLNQYCRNLSPFGFHTWIFNLKAGFFAVFRCKMRFQC